jgi:hypothetical protein
MARKSSGDVVIKNIRVLNQLDLPLDRLSEQFVINIVLSKLDEETQKAFQVTQKSNELASLEATCQFLQGRCQPLSTLEVSRPSTSKSVGNKPSGPAKTQNQSHILHATTVPTVVCPQCQGSHFLNQCKEFRRCQHKKDSRLPSNSESAPTACGRHTHPRTALVDRAGCARETTIRSCIRCLIKSL